MTTPLVIVGAGGFGRETLDIVEALNNQACPPFKLLGVLDDEPSGVNLARLDVRGVTHLGPIDLWLSEGVEADYVIAVGNPDTRHLLSGKFSSVGLSPVTVVHPRAQIGSVSEIGSGSVICTGVRVSTNVHIGSHVHLNPSVTIGHDTILGDYVSANPAATISGECAIGDFSLLGAGSVILQGLRVGVGATVGAAACVVRNVGDRAVVKGVPAR